jgi:hypothetical protein
MKDAVGSFLFLCYTEQIKLLVETSGFTVGLARTLANHSQSFSERIWLLDNSGSMAIGDGFRIVETPGRRPEGQRCTRWQELFETVQHHAKIASILQFPTEFRLLNYPGERAADLLGDEYEFHVGVPGADKAHEIRVAQLVMQRAKPTGFTPLTERLNQVQQKIRKKADDCYAQGKRVALVIATDGLPTDSAGNETNQAREDFVMALKEIEDLPVWLVIRLCTDEIKVHDFYNGLDRELELSMEVLDDHAGEAREVARQNKWLNYGLPLQRCRELGCSERLFDLIDERPLGKAEIRTFCANLFGLNLKSLPDPNESWKAFVKAIEKELKLHPEQWDPIKEKMAPWISIRNLAHNNGRSGSLIPWRRK